jgi:hypothetical protein
MIVARHHVALRVAALLVLPGLLYATAAGALDDRPAVTAQQPATSSNAPVGHRQPTAADVAKEPQQTAADREREKRDRALDKRLQICRGC